MDPPPDPPFLAAQSSAPLPTSAAPVANPTPSQSPIHNHPPYAEMITAAISALKERDGSSKVAIAKYIESNYSNLPSTHSALLSHHLKRLKGNGQLVMVKYSYKLPGSANGVAAANGGAVTAVNAVFPDPDSTVQKRRPGRPPKVKPDEVQAAVPVFDPPLNTNAVPAFQPSVNIPADSVNGQAVVTPARGRGRPRKLDSVKQGPSNSGGGLSRPRGRPRKNVAAGALAVQGGGLGSGKPRGRPKKSINSIEGLAVGAVVPVVGKRRGRPPKVGGQPKKLKTIAAGKPKTPRKLSGKPLGRPRKNSSTPVARTPDSRSHLLVSYLDLKSKLENLQTRVTQTAKFIKPTLNNEVAINAIQELELLAMDVNMPPNAPVQQTQPQSYPVQSEPPPHPELPPFQI